MLGLQYNTLNEYLPQYDDLPRRLLRSACIGFCSSAISDTCSNSIRVVKTSKQAATEAITYPEVVRVMPAHYTDWLVLGNHREGFLGGHGVWKGGRGAPKRGEEGP
jgi:hypothetical protein